MIFGKLWSQAFVFAAVVVAVCSFDVDDECGEGDCSLEMLHLRAKKLEGSEELQRTSHANHEDEEEAADAEDTAAQHAEETDIQNADDDSTELNLEADNDVQNENEDFGKKCLTWTRCRNGFFRGMRCSGGRYCTRWGGGSRRCRKYVSCRRGFFNGINCHGSRHCVSWF
ncbi:unnamed protein product [Symbiodinium pilosum]|uniref:Uncharacterized protein n=1 Tax=Symbiodinium pilosum TaxID=2952 RepID=A0A812QM52_SYMPI|nr:unnamed protein product [Symbiodinium pilosum]